MYEHRINKNFHPEPTSFENLVRKYTKRFSRETRYVCVKITTPLYVVNKKTGLLTEIKNSNEDIPISSNSILFTKSHCYEKNVFCSIRVLIDGLNKIGNFLITEEQKNENSFIEPCKNSTYSTTVENYALFLHQKDAAAYSKKIWLKKREKINEEIELLTYLEI